MTRSKTFGVPGGQLPSRDLSVYDFLQELFEEGQRTGEVRDDIPALELAEIYSVPPATISAVLEKFEEPAMRLVPKRDAAA